MPRPRRNRRPAGTVNVVCTGRGTHDPVPLEPDIQFWDAGDGKLRLKWNKRQGSGPVTAFSDAEGFRTYENRCAACGRHFKRREDKLGVIVRVLAQHQGIAPADNTPVVLDISRVERL